MNTKRINKLMLSVNTGTSVFIVSNNSTAIVAEAILLGTNVGNQSAQIAILISGDRGDLNRLGITRMADEKVITTQPTEIIPGVAMVLRGKRTRRCVGANSAYLCVAANRDDWQILRESVADKVMLQHGKRLQSIATTKVVEGCHD